MKGDSRDDENDDVTGGISEHYFGTIAPRFT